MGKPSADKSESLPSRFGWRYCDFRRKYFPLTQQFRQFPGGLLAFPAGQTFAWDQYQSAGIQMRFEQSEAFPQQTTCPVAFDGQETVLFSAYDSATYGWVRSGRHYRQHAFADLFDTLLPNLIEFGPKTQFILLTQTFPDRIPIFRRGFFRQRCSAGRLGIHQAVVNRARPF